MSRNFIPPFVVQQAQTAIAGDNEIGAPITIDVADGTAGPGAGPWEARAGGHVLEGGHRAGAAVPVQRAALVTDQEQVQPAIAIRVQESAAGADRLPYIQRAPPPVPLPEPDARGCGDIPEEG
jgi:hypothetical protein